MNNMAGQPQTTFMPLGEALQYADRCRNEGRLMEAEAVCRQILQAQPNTAGSRASPRRHRPSERQAWRGDRACAAREPSSRRRSRCFTPISARCFALPGRPKLAVDEARRALAIEPDMPAALSNLGVALYELKDYEEAARAQRKAIAAEAEFRRSPRQSRQCAACAAAVRRGDRRLSPRHRAQARLCRWLGQSRHHAAS